MLGILDSSTGDLRRITWSSGSHAGSGLCAGDATRTPHPPRSPAGTLALLRGLLAVVSSAPILPGLRWWHRRACPRSPAPTPYARQNRGKIEALTTPQQEVPIRVPIRLAPFKKYLVS
jgi:hypothetical protein